MMVSPGVFSFFKNVDFSSIKGQKIAQNGENKNYIRYVPYLRNSTTYDHNFWYTCAK